MSPLALQLARLLQAAGIQTSVPAATLAATLVANAEQYATITDTLLLPALIWAINQILTTLPGQNKGLVYAGVYGSLGPQFLPNSSGALAIDIVTRRQWQYSFGVWT